MEKYEKPEMEIIEFDDTEVKILTADDTTSAPITTNSLHSTKQTY